MCWERSPHTLCTLLMWLARDHRPLLVRFPHLAHSRISLSCTLPLPRKLENQEYEFLCLFLDPKWSKTKILTFFSQYVAVIIWFCDIYLLMATVTIRHLWHLLGNGKCHNRTFVTIYNVQTFPVLLNQLLYVNKISNIWLFHIPIINTLRTFFGELAIWENGVRDDVHLHRFLLWPILFFFRHFRLWFDIFAGHAAIVHVDVARRNQAKLLCLCQTAVPVPDEVHALFWNFDQFALRVR